MDKTLFALGRRSRRNHYARLRRPSSPRPLKLGYFLSTEVYWRTLCGMGSSPGFGGSYTLRSLPLCKTCERIAAKEELP